jgi:hypothetical protein
MHVKISEVLCTKSSPCVHIVRQTFPPQRPYRMDFAGEAVCTDATLLALRTLVEGRYHELIRRSAMTAPVCPMRTFCQSILEGESETIIEGKITTLIE